MRRAHTGRLGPTGWLEKIKHFSREAIALLDTLTLNCATLFRHESVIMGVMMYFRNKAEKGGALFAAERDMCNNGD